MANLSLNIISPTDNSSIDVQVESGWSADFVIQELIREKFLRELPNPEKEEYHLVYKETNLEFFGATTLEQAGVENNKVVSVVIRPKAGGTRNR